MSSVAHADDEWGGGWGGVGGGGGGRRCVSCLVAPCCGSGVLWLGWWQREMHGGCGRVSTSE